MLASLGFIVQATGYHFPGMLGKDVSFESLAPLNPIDQWDHVPVEGNVSVVSAWRQHPLPIVK